MGATEERVESFAEPSVHSAFSFAGLGRHLPEDALESLAREVLRRMARDEPPAGLAPSNSTAAPAARRRPESHEIAALCDALVSPDRQAADAALGRLRERGETLETIYLNYLTPVARELGNRWEDDRASFMEVSMGIGRIYGLMHELRMLLPVTPAALAPHAVFASLPGDSHTLGVTVASDLFRNRGWDVDLLVGLDHDSLVQAIDRTPAPIVGISASSGDELPQLLRLVVALHVGRPAMRVFIAGNIAADHPEIDRIEGIDGAACEFESAYSQMCAIYDSLAPRQTHATP